MLELLKSILGHQKMLQKIRTWELLLFELRKHLCFAACLDMHCFLLICSPFVKKGLIWWRSYCFARSKYPITWIISNYLKGYVNWRAKPSKYCKGNSRPQVKLAFLLSETACDTLTSRRQLIFNCRQIVNNFMHVSK